MTETTKRIYLGDMGVDSGTVLIADPCYWVKSEKEWESILEEKANSPVAMMPFEGENVNPAPLRGLVADTRNGDGIYPVFAILDAEGKVTKLEIVFFEDGLDVRYKEYQDKLDEKLKSGEFEA